MKDNENNGNQQEEPRQQKPKFRLNYILDETLKFGEPADEESARFLKESKEYFLKIIHDNPDAFQIPNK